jgi:hypothetical protein
MNDQPPAWRFAGRMADLVLFLNDREKGGSN